MNATQRNYAATRVKAILTDRLKALQEGMKVPAKTISDSERVELIRSGKVKLRPDATSINTYTNVVDVFDFSKFARPAGYRVGYEEAEKALRDEARKVEDRIMLGDTEAAIALLDAFATGAPALA
jgi:aspartate/methionine/tyrosine aminotransferase